jgi:glycosyltransferase involved in cell wall biosynthesis
VPTINNGQDFRYEYNMQSIYNQNYTNYKIVVIDDASTDLNFELIQQFVEENPVPQLIYLVKNKERVSALPNIYKAATQYCSPEDILVLLDGDDELLGVNVFKVFNSMYTLQKLEVLYSNIIINNRRNRNVRRGWSSAYTPDEKKYMKYREESTRMFPLRTFKVSTFLKIPVTDLQNDAGDFFKSAYDQTICPQVLELSCGRNEYIDEFNYLYNVGLGNNDLEVDPELNYRIMHIVRYKRQKHECPAQ